MNHRDPFQLEALPANGVRLARLICENLDHAAYQQGQSGFAEVDVDLPLIVDVASVEFADSAGLAIIRNLTLTLGHERFALVHVNPRLARCLERLPKNKQPRIFANIDEGIAALGQSAARVPRTTAVSTQPPKRLAETSK